MASGAGFRSRNLPLEEKKVAMPKLSDHQQIEPKYHEVMQIMGRLIDELLNGENCPKGQKKNGFALLVFPFGQPNNEHRCNYMSNADREDMLATMKEFIARAEGRYFDAPEPVNQG